MKIPTPITAGTSVSWNEPPALVNGQTLTSATYTGAVYLRANAAGAGLAVTGQAESAGGWDYAITTAQTAGLAAGVWYAEHLISYGSDVFSVGTAQLVVEPSLAFSGTAAAFDGRSQAEKDLEAVEAQIRSIVSSGTQMYMIGNRQRMTIQLEHLYKQRRYLKRAIAATNAKKLGTDYGLMLGVFQ